MEIPWSIATQGRNVHLRNWRKLFSMCIEEKDKTGPVSADNSDDERRRTARRANTLDLAHVDSKLTFTYVSRVFLYGISNYKGIKFRKYYKQ